MDKDRRLWEHNLIEPKIFVWPWIIHYIDTIGKKLTSFPMLDIVERR